MVRGLCIFSLLYVLSICLLILFLGFVTIDVRLVLLLLLPVNALLLLFIIFGFLSVDGLLSTRLIFFLFVQNYGLH